MERKVEWDDRWGTLKSIRQSKVGESTSPVKRPFKNVLRIIITWRIRTT